MSKLYIESQVKIRGLKKIAKAVYKTLNQRENLKAELVFVDRKEIRRLNRETRNVDKVTDVLSYPTLDNIRGKILDKKKFPLDYDGKFLFIGSIVLNEDKVKEQAKELGHGEKIERQYLIVHALMHLMGYDHIEEKDKKQMRKKEKEALLLLGIKD